MASLPVSLTRGLLLALLSGCAPATHAGQGNSEDVPEASPPPEDSVTAKGVQGNKEDAPEPNPPPEIVVTAEDIQRSPNLSIQEILMRRFPGVWVTRGPGGGIAIRIRGSTSIYGSNEPLYVIDGLPITPGPGGSLFGINPYDIESIQVLKNAADTAMYGVRGANGVIVIKTKQPDH